MHRALHLAAVVVLAAATVLSAGKLRAARARPYDVEVVPPAAAVRWFSLGHPLLASHLYWLRAVQYIGEPRADVRGWDKLYPLVDLITDLDPGHGYAYQVAGVVLSSAERLQESNAILEKGTRNVPGRYILPYFRAFNAFYYENDWPAAGRWAEVAARAPGAPEHIRQNVLAYYVKGGRADAAVQFLEHTYQTAEDDETRKAVKAQLDQAYFEQTAGPLDEAVLRWRERHVLGPVALESLVEDGLVDALPADPFGGELYVGADGRVRSTLHEKRLAPAPTPGALHQDGVLGGVRINRKP
jgi:tetratricopeptide (TPR) repeat protein